jgi:CRISPR-associated protein Csm4
MNNWRLVKLNFGNSPAHFGELGIGMEQTSDRVHSDTLFSAWISACARLFKKDEFDKLLKRFLNTSQPVTMSSTFVYRHRDNRDIYYLPRPLKFPANYPAGDGDLEFFKAYKKLNYLPLEVWHKWYQEEGFTSEDRQELIKETNNKKSDGFLHEQGTFSYKEAFKIGQEPKIAVDRVTRATNFYHTGFVQFQWEQNGNDIKSRSGLYFLLKFSQKDETLEKQLQAALQLLGEEGIGGERSSGAGHFEVEWLPLPEMWQRVVNFKASQYTLISLLWEEDPSILKELITENKEACYEIIERGGWISGQQLRRQMLRMFTEGSVFASPPLGKIADVTPHQLIDKKTKKPKKHPIYRSGISLSLPIKVKSE